MALAHGVAALDIAIGKCTYFRSSGVGQPNMDRLEIAMLTQHHVALLSR